MREKDKGGSNKIVTVKYSGLIGKLFNPKDKVIEGYSPVVAESDTDTEIVPARAPINPYTPEQPAQEQITQTTTPDPAVLTTITLSPISSSIASSDSQQLTASTFNQYNQNIAATITWSSSDETKATVDVNGLVTGVVAGSVTITASSGTVSGTASITITAPATTEPQPE